MKQENNNNAIVFGVNHHNTLGVLRSLGEAGVRSDLILIVTDNLNPYVAKCRYIDKLVCVSNEQEGLEALRCLVLTYFKGQRRVVFPTYDSVCKILDQYYDELSSYLYLPSCYGKGGVLSSFLDKENMRKVAEEVGFKTPQSFLLNCSNGIDISDNLEYPCMIKTIESVIGGKDLMIYRDRESLLDGLNMLNKHSKRIQIQQYITKDSEFEILGASFGEGNHLIPCVVDKIRQSPINVGNTSYAFVTPKIEKYVDVTKLQHYLDKLNYVGLYSIEFIRKDNDIYFLEINLRNDGMGYVSTPLGVNLPYSIYQHFYKCSIEDMLGKRITSEGILFSESGELLNVKNGDLSAGKWLVDYLSSDVKLYWNFKDIKPFIVYGANLIERLLRKLLKGKRG